MSIITYHYHYYHHHPYHHHHRYYASLAAAGMRVEGAISELGGWKKAERQHVPSMIQDIL